MSHFVVCFCNDGNIFLTSISVYVFLNIVRVNIIMKWKSNKLNAFNNLFFTLFGSIAIIYPHIAREFYLRLKL